MKLNTNQKRNLTFATILSVLVIFFLLKPFLSTIMAAAITAFIFAPIYKKLQKKFKSNGAPAALTILISILVVVIPLFVVIIISINQARIIFSQLDTFLNSGKVVLKDIGLLDRLNDILRDLTNGAVNVTPKELQNVIIIGAKNAGEALLSVLVASVNSVPRIITNLIIYIYVYSALLLHYPKLIKLVKNLNPLGEEVTDMYLERAGLMTTSLAKGQLIIAIMQGISGALFLQIAGIHYFAFFAVVLTVFSIVPLGGGIISIPIGVIMLATGNIWQGLFVLGTHFLVITNIDNVMKPYLVPKSIRLNPALLIMSVMSGLIMFGFIGIIVGPVIVILALATIDTYVTIKNAS